MSLRDLQDEAAAWKRWERGQGPEPTTRLPPVRDLKLHCECGEGFGMGEFDRWQAHVAECPELEQEG